MSKIDSLNLRLKTAILNILSRRKQYLEVLTHAKLEKTPLDLIAKYRLMTDNFERHVLLNTKKIVTKCRADYEKEVAILDSLSPLKTMSRGYSVVNNSKGELISKVSDVNIGDDIVIKVTDGKINAKVHSIL